jgi:hypothetical protein
MWMNSKLHEEHMESGERGMTGSGKEKEILYRKLITPSW